MMPLVDRPFVAHQIALLRRHGVTDVVFSCGYRPGALEAYFGDGAAEGMRIRYVVDPVPLGTAGAIKNAQHVLDAEQRILVLNGDVLTDLDLGALVAAHEESEVLGSLTLTDVDDPSRYGLVRLFADRTVEAFVEKPDPGDLRPGEPFRINAGTYLFEAAVLDEIPDGVACSIERDVFPRLATDGRLAGYPSGAYWRDIGTPESYLQAHVDVLTGAVRTEAPLGDRYLGAGCVLEEGAVVDGHSSLGTGTHVWDDAIVDQSVIGETGRVGVGAHLEGAIVGAGVEIGEGARLGHGVVVGDGARIAPGVELVGCTVATGEIVK